MAAARPPYQPAVMRTDSAMPCLSEKDIIRFVGTTAAERGKRYGRSGAVGTVSWEETATSTRASTLTLEGEVRELLAGDE